MHVQVKKRYTVIRTSPLHQTLQMTKQIGRDITDMEKRSITRQVRGTRPVRPTSDGVLVAVMHGDSQHGFHFDVWLDAGLYVITCQPKRCVVECRAIASNSVAIASSVIVIGVGCQKGAEGRAWRRYGGRGGCGGLRQQQ